MTDHYTDFAKLCAGALQEGLLEEYFAFLFTPTELEAIFKRLQLVDALLVPKMPQREMAQVLNMSIAKITRGSNALKQVSPALRTFLMEHRGQN